MWRQPRSTAICCLYAAARFCRVSAACAVPAGAGIGGYPAVRHHDQARRGGCRRICPPPVPGPDRLLEFEFLYCYRRPQPRTPRHRQAQTVSARPKPSSPASIVQRGSLARTGFQRPFRWRGERLSCPETPKVNWGIRGQNAADLTLNYRVEV